LKGKNPLIDPRFLYRQYRNLLWLIGLLSLSLPLAAQSSAAGPSQETAVQPPEAAQPSKEKVDLEMYQRICDQGFNHSAVMGYAEVLADDIGPRLTGSPNMARANKWTRDQLAEMGAANAHIEPWGESGLGWQQLNTWVRMVSPDTAVFIAQATPWSPGTAGPVTGDAVSVDIEDESEFARYTGKLAGKIVLFGPLRPVLPVEGPLFTRLSDDDLKQLTEYSSTDTSKIRNEKPQKAETLKREDLREKIAKFFADEHAAAVIIPAREAQEDAGGSGGIIFDDNGAYLGTQPYNVDHRLQVPVVVMAIEHFGRMYRLLKNHVPVTVQMDVETKFTGDHELGYNTIAEIPGTDPSLKDQLVMLGGHLDSWVAGTGAADNGAGVAVSMEVLRILLALHVQPRRTIRIGLWSGEEQGHRGSLGYTRAHFGAFPLSTNPEQLNLPEWHRKAVGPITLLPDQKLVSAYFNLDNGGGRIRGIYLQENFALQPIFAQWIDPLKTMGVTTLTLQNTSNTDHISFDAIGIPGFEFIQDPLDYHTRRHHSNMDVYEGLLPGDLQQAAVVEAIFVYNTAMRDQMLPRKPLVDPRSGSTTVQTPDLFPDAVHSAHTK
jgi:carboxypeptidase Q